VSTRRAQVQGRKAREAHGVFEEDRTPPHQGEGSPEARAQVARDGAQRSCEGGARLQTERRADIECCGDIARHADIECCGDIARHADIECCGDIARRADIERCAIESERRAVEPGYSDEEIARLASAPRRSTNVS
jgi:hypothetical protein